MAGHLPAAVLLSCVPGVALSARLGFNGSYARAASRSAALDALRTCGDVHRGVALALAVGLHRVPWQRAMLLVGRSGQVLTIVLRAATGCADRDHLGGRLPDARQLLAGAQQHHLLRRQPVRPVPLQKILVRSMPFS